MTTSSPTSVVQNPPKSSPLPGCLVTALILLFAVLAVCELVWGSVIAYVFSSAHMLSLFNTGIILIIAFQCFIYFLLVFRIKRQHRLALAENGPIRPVTRTFTNAPKGGVKMIFQGLA